MVSYECNRHHRRNYILVISYFYQNFIPRIITIYGTSQGKFKPHSTKPHPHFQLNSRLQEDTMQVFFEGLFPKDNPKNTRFAVNFFTSIGLGGLTDDLREFLKTGSLKAGPGASDSESSDSDSGSDSSSSSSDSSSDDEPENIEALFNKLQKKKAKEEVDVSMKYIPLGFLL